MAGSSIISLTPVRPARGVTAQPVARPSIGGVSVPGQEGPVGPGGSVDTVNGRKGTVTLTSSDVNLANVANLAPADLPVSTAQAQADTAVQVAAASDASSKASAAQAAAIATAATDATMKANAAQAAAISTAAADATTKANARAAKGANSDITSLFGLTTALSVAQGGLGNGTGDASGLSVKATGGSPRTLQARASDTVNVADVGVAAAFSTANAGKEIIVPPGTWSLSSTATIPDGSRVRFLGRNAVIAYTGTGPALQVRRSKNVRIDGLNVDLTGADAAAEALRISGCWYLNINDPRVLANGANQSGIVLETSYAASGTITDPLQSWGTYMVEIVNAQMIGTGLYAIRTYQTNGNTTSYVTHLNIRGGWSKGFSYGLYIRNLSTGRIEGWVSDTGIDAINMDYADDIFLSPGELGPGSGYGINLGSNLQRIWLISPSRAGVGGSLGYINTANFTPHSLDSDKLHIHSPNGQPNYWIEVGAKAGYNSLSAYINAGGGSFFATPQQLLGFIQGVPTTAGQVLVGDPTRKSETTLGRNNTAVADTAGFVQVPSVAGTPTGAVASLQSGYTPILIDSLNKQINAFFGSAWVAIPSVTATTGITAAGTTQVTATALTTRLNVVRTGGVGTGVVLSSTLAGSQIVINRTGVALLVYPPTGGLIDDGATNAAVTIPAKGSATFERYPGGIAFFTSAQATATQ